MKTMICVFLILISIETNSLHASTSRNLHMPSKGYWVVENDPFKCDRAFVHYYDVNDNMLHSELIVLRSEDFLNNRLKRRFNKKLKQVLFEEEMTKASVLDNRSFSKSR